MTSRKSFLQVMDDDELMKGLDPNFLIEKTSTEKPPDKPRYLDDEQKEIYLRQLSVPDVPDEPSSQNEPWVDEIFDSCYQSKGYKISESFDNEAEIMLKLRKEFLQDQ